MVSRRHRRYGKPGGRRHSEHWYTTPTLSAATSYWVRVSNGRGVSFSNTATVAVYTPPMGVKGVLSANGRFLAFESADPTLVCGDSNAASDIFVTDRTKPIGRPRARQRFIDGHAGERRQRLPAIGADGRFVVFASDATKLVPGDTNGVRDIFLRDRDADGNGVFDEPGGVTTGMVSVSTDGAPGRGGERVARDQRQRTHHRVRVRRLEPRLRRHQRRARRLRARS